MALVVVAATMVVAVVVAVVVALAVAVAVAVVVAVIVAVAVAVVVAMAMAMLKARRTVIPAEVVDAVMVAAQNHLVLYFVLLTASENTVLMMQ
jgi:hypothetical protein